MLLNAQILLNITSVPVAASVASGRVIVHPAWSGSTSLNPAAIGPPAKDDGHDKTILLVSVIN
jgi:hypothetical protein